MGQSRYFFSEIFDGLSSHQRKYVPFLMKYKWNCLNISLTRKFLMFLRLQLTFMSHVSTSFNLVKTRSKREDPHEMSLAYPKVVKADTREVNERVNHRQDDLLENHQNDIHDNSRGVVANLNSSRFICLEGGSIQLGKALRED